MQELSVLVSEPFVASYDDQTQPDFDSVDPNLAFFSNFLRPSSYNGMQFGGQRTEQLWELAIRTRQTAV